MTLIFRDHASSRGESPTNEDVAGLRGDYGWVIDGASGLGGPDVSGAPSDALWIAFMLHQAIDAVIRTDGGRSPKSVLARAQQLIRDRWSGAPVSFPPSATVLLVRAASGKLDFCLLGDVELTLARGNRVVRTITDDRVEKVNAGALRKLSAALRADSGRDEALNEVDEALRRDRRTRMNVHGGYSVATPLLIPVADAVSGTWKFQPGDLLMLASDGFARIHRLFTLDSLWSDAATGHTELSEAIQHLRAAERATATDPDHARWNIHDDATAVLAELP